MNPSSKTNQQATPPDGLPGAVAVLKRGQAAARAGKKAEARFYFQKVLEASPDHPDALLWLAYLAGGGRPSLEYLVRLLESDPTNQRARAAIRWARSRPRSQPKASASAPARRARTQGQSFRSSALVLVVVAALIVGGLATAAFGLELPKTTPTKARLLAALPTEAAPTNVPTATPNPPTPTNPPPTATPTNSPAPTATPSPVPPALATFAAETELMLPATVTPTPFPPTATVAPSPVPPTPLPTAPIGDSFRWIDVDLTNQRLIAYQGETAVRWVTVSTGLPRTPTVTGRYKIYVKYRSAGMSGPGYNLPNVPYVMYFYRGYGLHGTYWHNNFGQPMSHGCVNLPTPEAEWVFNWASVGTPVVIHY